MTPQATADEILHLMDLLGRGSPDARFCQLLAYPLLRFRKPGVGIPDVDDDMLANELRRIAPLWFPPRSVEVQTQENRTRILDAIRSLTSQHPNWSFVRAVVHLATWGGEAQARKHFSDIEDSTLLAGATVGVENQLEFPEETGQNDLSGEIGDYSEPVRKIELSVKDLGHALDDVGTRSSAQETIEADSRSGLPWKSTPEGVMNTDANAGHGSASTRDFVSDDVTTDPTSADYTFLAPSEEGIGRFGRYRVVRVIGFGAMAIVFEAEDPDLGRKVALKVMQRKLAQNDRASRRFLREGRALANIFHENVVSVFEVGEWDKLPYLTMPLLEGETLAAKLRRQEQLSLVKVLAIGRQIALGLAAAHNKRYVHRDVKPTNVWILASTGRAILLDFGLAHLMDDNSPLSIDGSIIGTPEYMAPEQIEGNPDARSDLFSLGCLLYCLMTGKQPFQRRTATATLSAVVNEQPATVHHLNPTIPSAVSDIVMKLMAKQARDRFSTSEQLVDALDGIIWTLKTVDQADVQLLQQGPKQLPPAESVFDDLSQNDREQLLAVAAGSLNVPRIQLPTVMSLVLGQARRVQLIHEFRSHLERSIYDLDVLVRDIEMGPPDIAQTEKRVRDLLRAFSDATRYLTEQDCHWPAFLQAVEVVGTKLKIFKNRAGQALSSAQATNIQSALEKTQSQARRVRVELRDMLEGLADLKTEATYLLRAMTWHLEPSRP